MNRTDKSKEDVFNLDRSRSAELKEKQEYIDLLELQRSKLTDALGELYGLLEEYAPAWYTESHHERAKFALRLVTASGFLQSGAKLSPKAEDGVLNS